MNKTVPPRHLEARHLLEARSLKFPAHHFLFDIFNRKLQQYFEADLVNFNTRLWRERSDPKKYEKYEEPFAILTLGELEAGFFVCMAPFILGILAFVFEWIAALKNLIVFLIIFKKYFDLKKVEQSEHGEKMKIKIASWVLRKRL